MESTEEYLSLLLRRSYEDHVSRIDRKKEPKSPVHNHTDSRLNGEPSPKKSKTAVDEFITSHPFIRKLTPYTFNFTATTDSSQPSACANKSVPVTPKRKHFNHLINAIGHPHILKQICEQYIKNIANDN